MHAPSVKPNTGMTQTMNGVANVLQECGTVDEVVEHLRGEGYDASIRKGGLFKMEWYAGDEVKVFVRLVTDRTKFRMSNSARGCGWKSCRGNITYTKMLEKGKFELKYSSRSRRDGAYTAHWTSANIGKFHITIMDVKKKKEGAAVNISAFSEEEMRKEDERVLAMNRREREYQRKRRRERETTSGDEQKERKRARVTKTVSEDDRVEWNIPKVVETPLGVEQEGVAESSSADEKETEYMADILEWFPTPDSLTPEGTYDPILYNDELIESELGISTLEMISTERMQELKEIMSTHIEGY